MPCNCDNSLQQYNYSQSSNSVQDRQWAQNDSCGCNNCKQKHYVEKSTRVDRKQRKDKSKCGCDDCKQKQRKEKCDCGCTNSKQKSSGCGCDDCKCKPKNSGKDQDVLSDNQKDKKRCDKCRSRKCQCVKYVPCFKTKCGVISASLTKTAFPTFYTTVGQIITYTYTITNTGDIPICDPIRICDDHLGGQIIPRSFILPGISQSYTRTYTILPSDLLIPGITNIATAYIEVDCKCWVATCPASATVTFGNADLFGTISQALVVGAAPGTVEVTVTISNSALSATSAENVSLTLPFPAGISAVTAGVPPPTTISPTSVSFNLASLGIGASSTFRFRYIAGSTISGASYVFAGTILASTFDPNPSNNFLSSTFVFP